MHSYYTELCLNSIGEAGKYGNLGDNNEGFGNIGNDNEGNCNIGNKNKGNYNIGSYNIGDGNIGNGNKGNWNCDNNNEGDYIVEKCLGDDRKSIFYGADNEQQYAMKIIQYITDYWKDLNIGFIGERLSESVTKSLACSRLHLYNGGVHNLEIGIPIASINPRIVFDVSQHVNAPDTLAMLLYGMVINNVTNLSLRKDNFRSDNDKDEYYKKINSLVETDNIYNNNLIYYQTLLNLPEYTRFVGKEFQVLGIDRYNIGYDDGYTRIIDKGFRKKILKNNSKTNEIRKRLDSDNSEKSNEGFPKVEFYFSKTINETKEDFGIDFEYVIDFVFVNKILKVPENMLKAMETIPSIKDKLSIMKKYEARYKGESILSRHPRIMGIFSEDTVSDANTSTRQKNMKRGIKNSQIVSSGHNRFDSYPENSKQGNDQNTLTEKSKAPPYRKPIRLAKDRTGKPEGKSNSNQNQKINEKKIQLKNDIKKYTTSERQVHKIYSSKKEFSGNCSSIEKRQVSGIGEADIHNGRISLEQFVLSKFSKDLGYSIDDYIEPLIVNFTSLYDRSEKKIHREEVTGSILTNSGIIYVTKKDPRDRYCFSDIDKCYEIAKNNKNSNTVNPANTINEICGSMANPIARFGNSKLDQSNMKDISDLGEKVGNIKLSKYQVYNEDSCLFAKYGIIDEPPIKPSNRQRLAKRNPLALLSKEKFSIQIGDKIDMESVGGKSDTKTTSQEIIQSDSKPQIIPNQYLSQEIEKIQSKKIVENIAF
ncbi:putative PPE family protein PPE42 [Smittium culicis]|uniref:Putative PPE family protein PPE42 n=1 Tax=Smittium culicis TaxID=133412 RepID=A0A1R1XZS0_9FUNG|nr:putative PPE family protein PPE42 [Smittium culicis]